MFIKQATVEVGMQQTCQPCQELQSMNEALVDKVGVSGQELQMKDALLAEAHTDQLQSSAELTETKEALRALEAESTTKLKKFTCELNTANTKQKITKIATTKKNTHERNKKHTH